MDKIIIIQLIKDCFPQCTIHKDFPSEFLELATGDEKAVFNLFQRRLSTLSSFNAPPPRTSWFERLKHNSDLYSMHIKTKEKNIRILLSWDENGIIYLHPFHERAGKSNTSYKPHIEKAIKRHSEQKEKQE